MISFTQEREASKECCSAQPSKPAAAWRKVADPSVPVNPGVASCATECGKEENLCLPHSPKERCPLAPHSLAVMPGRLPLHVSRRRRSWTASTASLMCPGTEVAQQPQKTGTIARPPQLHLVPVSLARCKRKFVPPRARSDKET